MLLFLLALDVLRIITYHTLIVCSHHEGSGKGWNGL